MAYPYNKIRHIRSALNFYLGQGELYVCIIIPQPKEDSSASVVVSNLGSYEASVDFVSRWHKAVTAHIHPEHQTIQ